MYRTFHLGLFRFLGRVEMNPICHQGFDPTSFGVFVFDVRYGQIDSLWCELALQPFAAGLGCWLLEGCPFTAPW